MILKTVNDPELMWSVYGTLSDLFLTTANATVSRKTGRLVMGKGHALQMKQRLSRNLDKALARAAEERVAERMMSGEWRGSIFRNLDNDWRVVGDYYLLVSQNWPKVKVGLFQTKRFFEDVRDKVHPDVSGHGYTVANMVHWSTLALERWCKEHPTSRVDMPFPGIGAGGCSRDEILPSIQRLPDTVYVWELV